jgi:hypothetical protein
MPIGKQLAPLALCSLAALSITMVYGSRTAGAVTRDQSNTTALIVNGGCNNFLPGSVTAMTPAPGSFDGYWIANSQGLVVLCPPNVGGNETSVLGPPIVAIAATPDGNGWWEASTDGGVDAYGDAQFYGSAVGFNLNQPVVGMALTPDSRGYWLVAADGGIFAFGDAVFFGSAGSIHLNQPVVGIAADPATGGYWLVAADGGVFAFNAPFNGSMGDRPLNQPVVGIASTANGSGYSLAAADGGVFAFGAPFDGSTGSLRLNAPIVQISSDGATGGYWLLASDGGVFAFNAPFFGSAVTPPPPPPPPPLASASCAVTMTSPDPSQYSNETAEISSNLPNAPVTITVSYKTATTSFFSTTQPSGIDLLTFYISRAIVGYPVQVHVSISNDAAMCSTSFTPT